jgi:hypothetical protein
LQDPQAVVDATMQYNLGRHGDTRSIGTSEKPPMRTRGDTGSLGQKVEMFAGGLPDEMRARTRRDLTVDEDATRRRAHWPAYLPNPELPNGLSPKASSYLPDLTSINISILTPGRKPQVTARIYIPQKSSYHCYGF